MLPILYESNETTFNHNGIGVLKDSTYTVAEEELNGPFELELRYSSGGFLFDEIKNERIIKAKANDSQDEQLFRIYSVTKDHDSDGLIVNAQHITYDIAKNFVEKLEANNLTMRQVMEQIKSSAAYPMRFNMTSSNNTTRSSTKLYRTNPLQMVGGMEGSVLQIWGGQIERDNFNFVLHTRRGSDNNVRISYSKNLTGLEAVFGLSDLVTRIFPFKLIEATEDEPERLITLKEKYIDSPLIDDYAMPHIMPLDLSQEESIENATDLYNAAKNWFKETNRDKAKVSLSINFEQLSDTEEYKDLAVLEKVSLGDTVAVDHEILGIEASANVNKIEYDSIAEKNVKVELGSARAKLTEKMNATDEKLGEIANSVNEVESKANDAMVAANGKNKNYYGPDEPKGDLIEGDTWFKLVDGQYTQTYRWDGVQWQLIIDMDTAEAKQEVQKAVDSANKAVERVGEVNKKADESLAKAQESFDKVKDVDNKADQSLKTAQESFDKAESAIKLSNEVDKKVLDVKTTAEGLKVDIINKADKTEVTALAGVVKTKISNEEAQLLVKASADGIYKEIGKVESETNSKFYQVTETIDGMQTVIKDKADKTEITALAGVVDVKLTDLDKDISNRITATSESLNVKIDNIKVGGVNIISDSNNFSKFVGYGGAKRTEFETNISVDEWGAEDATRLVFNGGTGELKSTPQVFARASAEVTYSFWIKNEGIRNIDLIFNGLNIKNSNMPLLGRTIRLEPEFSGRIIVTGVLRDNYDWFQHQLRTTSAGHTLRVVMWQDQLEYGTMATDWSPSPEDISAQFSMLQDNINLRVKHNDVANQLNLDKSGVLISGKKLILDGDTTVRGTFKLEGSAHIKDASIGTAQIGSIDAAKINSGEINTNLVNVFGGNATNYTHINGPYIESRGQFRRTWKGKTKTHDNKTILDKGYIRLRNDTEGWSLYYGDSFISTFADGDGGGMASGTIEFRDNQFSTANGVTMHSNHGVVALQSEQNRVILDAKTTANIEASDFSVYIRPYRDSLPGNNEFRFWVKEAEGAGGTDGVLTYGSSNLGQTSGLRFEKTTVGRNSIWATDGAGIKYSADIHADRFYGDLAPKVSFAYVRAERLRIVQGANDQNYSDIQFNRAQLRSIRTMYEHLWLGASTGEIRGMNNNFNTYRDFRGSDFIKASSIAYKSHFNDIDYSSLDIINDLKVYEYYKKDDLAMRDYSNKQIGVVSELSPEIATKDGRGISDYKHVMHMTRAIQELSNLDKEKQSDIEAIYDTLVALICDVDKLKEAIA